MNNPVIGILFILCAGALLATHDGFSKYLTAIYPLALVVWLRYTVQTVLMIILFGPKMKLDLVRTKRPWLQLLRGLFLLGISGLFIGGLRYIPLAEATAVMFLAPLIVTVLSAIFLKEQISLGQWVAVVIGLCGVLLVVRPGGALFTWAILMPVAASFCFGSYQLIARRLASFDHTVTSNFLSGLIGTIALTVIMPFVSVEVQPAGWDLLFLLILGALGMVAHMLLTIALKYASAATLAPFTYGQIIFAALIGVFAFDQSPDLLAWGGVAIIIGSGILVAWLQRRNA